MEHSQHEQPKSETEKLTEEVRRLRRALEKSNSFRRSMAMSLFTGATAAIGATVIASIVLVGTLKFIKSSGLDSVFSVFGVEKTIESSIQQRLGPSQ